MEIVTVFTPNIEKWVKADDSHFRGAMAENLSYKLGITPPDPQDSSCVLINVFLEKEIINEGTKEQLFYARVHYCFRVRNLGNAPAEHFYYHLIDQSTRSFEDKYKEKTIGSIIHGRPTKTTPFPVLMSSISEAIKIWNDNHKNISLN
jgi:hypothetical protein